jgi:hypothetical protein
MHYKKIKVIILGVSVSISLYLGYIQNKDRPVDYARDALDLTSKVFVLLEQVAEKKKSESSSQKPRGNKSLQRRNRDS